MNDADQIAPNLFIGKMPKNIDAYQYVVSVGEKPSYPIPIGKTVLVAPLMDSHRVPTEERLMELATLVNQFTCLGPTLVHCTMGLNRSGLVMAAVLMQRGMRVGKIVPMLREKRDSQVLKNDSFIELLMEIDYKYKGKE